MERAQHKTNNDVLGAPPGVPIEQCHALPITRVQFADGVVAVLSYWRPTTRELELINAGAPVRLLVTGTTHAPLSLGVSGDGFGDLNGVPL